MRSVRMQILTPMISIVTPSIIIPVPIHPYIKIDDSQLVSPNKVPRNTHALSELRIQILRESSAKSILTLF